MFGLIEQVVVVSLSFSRSLAPKCLYLNNKLSITRLTHTDLNSTELIIIHS